MHCKCMYTVQNNASVTSSTSNLTAESIAHFAAGSDPKAKLKGLQSAKISFL